ncbi:MAG: 30S ribosomal protein S6 [Oscillospiraceae bacterium]
MANISMSYETIMVFSTKAGEETVTALVEKFKSLITDNATITEVNEWGKRKLAYEIDDQGEGYYVLINFTSSPAFPAELDRIYKITEGVLRTLIVKKEA